jgi:spermidine synthase
MGMAPAALCVFGSGLCALIYQTAWLREFRLIFGASTPASAAVLAIFMGGLGAGSLVLGKKTDRLGNPFHYYALLELGIALSAALTPGLLWLARQTYLGLGGTFTLGLALGTGLRLLLATLVLVVPTFFMGGTLPAVARAVQRDDDGRRRQVALLYGVNTLGAVTGAMLATFLLFEFLGNRLTLWSACVVNFAVAGLALRLARNVGPASRRPLGSESTEQTGPPSSWRAAAPVLSQGAGGTSALRERFILAAAAIVGFVFLLLELVWYRMLAPLLGGSTFTFGLILAVALLGMALGGLGLSIWRSGRPVTLAGFATVCALEALGVAIPLALGDRLAVLAIALQGLGALGFAARVAEWSVLVLVVVFPASLLAGAQFPMLIALLGEGRSGVGTHTGLAYGWNTAGAIAGSLAGGFGLLPLLTAPGAWRLSVALLVALAGAALVVAWHRERAARVPPATRLLRRTFPALTAGATALLCLAAFGPTAAWRHSPIGAGRVELKHGTLNDIQEFLHARRRLLLWEADGRESSLGLLRDSGTAYLVNGKSDGNARGDAATQVMVGLLGALAHPHPTRSLVVGLGSGSTAGWLAAVPGMERVDVVELEPAMRRVAEDCAPVNQNALGRPNLRLHLGDAREFILASRDRYDVMASEPSNPYRAGVASLFTREFYTAVAQRLRPGGVFVQWVQAYEVDGATISTIYATLRSAFACVETWETQFGDLALLATQEPVVHDLAVLGQRIQSEPYRSALAWVWRATDVEGVFARHVAHRDLADAAVASGAPVNTDDCNLLEFAFARTVGRQAGFDLNTLRRLAHDEQYDQPDTVNGELNAWTLTDRRASASTLDELRDLDIEGGDDAFRLRTAAKSAFVKGDLAAAAAQWLAQSQAPGDLIERLLLAEGLAEQGDDRALPHIEALRAWQSGEADAVLARYHWRRGQTDQAVASLLKCLEDWRRNPWALSSLVERTLTLAQEIGTDTDSPAVAQRVLDALSQPLVLWQGEMERTVAQLSVAQKLDPYGRGPKTRDIVASLEPNVPWTRTFLELRAETYQRTGDPRTWAAQRDLHRFQTASARPFGIAPRTVVAARHDLRTPAGPGLLELPRVQAREP